MIVSWCAATTGREVRQARPGLIELVVLGLSAAFSSDRECLLRPNPAQPLWVEGVSVLVKFEVQVRSLAHARTH